MWVVIVYKLLRDRKNIFNLCEIPKNMHDEVYFSR